MRAAAGPHLSKKKKNKKKIVFCCFFVIFINLVVLFLFLISRLLEYALTLFYFILELFKESWECGYNNNNNNIEENGKDYQRVFASDTDSSVLYALAPFPLPPSAKGYP